MLDLRPARLALALALALVSLAGGCRGETQDSAGTPQRECRTVVWAQAETAAASIELIGSWSGWDEPVALVASDEPGWYAAALELEPGVYGYLLREGGAARRDDYNPLTIFRELDGLEVSRLEVGDCTQPELVLDPASIVVEADPSGATVELDATFLAAAGPLARLDPESLVGEGLRVGEAEPELGVLHLEAEGLARGRTTLEFSVADVEGRRASERLSVFVDPVAPTWEDATVYQIMIDRFYADGGQALDPPATAGARAGGTLDGIQAALEQGYFEALGVSALWLSPVYPNPDEARLGTDGRLYEGYHGYWVTESRSVDTRLGGEQALRELIAAAHARGIAVILDVVPNHVYETHAIVAAHRDEGWFNEHPQACVCGTPSCPWSMFQIDCWFAPYLPDLRVEHGPAMDFAVGELLWWLESFELDGLRIDAVPMMPRAASRRIAHEVRRFSSPGRDRLVLGEVFVGPGPSGVAGLRYFLGEDGLDSVFDFPWMWAVRELLAPEGAGAGFTSYDALLDYIDETLAGSGAVLGRMLGNHDVSRLCSELVGDAGGDPWDEPASQPTGVGPTAEADQQVFDRIGLGLTLQLTSPGMPVLYYGDELGLAGANDPDNRRVMPAIDALSPPRAELLAHARTLGQLRRCMPALRTGARATVHVAHDTYAFTRRAADGAAALIVVSRADEPRTVTLPGKIGLAGPVIEVLGGGTLSLAGGTELELEPRSAQILIAEDDPCAP